MQKGPVQEGRSLSTGVLLHKPMLAGGRVKMQMGCVVLLRLDLLLVQRIGGCCFRVFWDPFRTPKGGVIIKNRYFRALVSAHFWRPRRASCLCSHGLEGSILGCVLRPEPNLTCFYLSPFWFCLCLLWDPNRHQTNG